LLEDFKILAISLHVLADLLDFVALQVAEKLSGQI
jgi:hypothetical protein